eukprot:1157256-Pelagomonas_calceolata.AAC.4
MKEGPKRATAFCEQFVFCVLHVGNPATSSCSSPSWSKALEAQPVAFNSGFQLKLELKCQGAPSSTIAVSALKFQGAPSSTIAVSALKCQGAPSSTIAVCALKFQGAPSSTIAVSALKCQGAPSSTIAVYALKCQGAPSSTIACQGAPSSTIAISALKCQGAPSSTIAVSELKCQGAPSSTIAVSALKCQGAPSSTIAVSELKCQGAPSQFLHSSFKEHHRAPLQFLDSSFKEHHRNGKSSKLILFKPFLASLRQALKDSQGQQPKALHPYYDDEEEDEVVRTHSDVLERLLERFACAVCENTRVCCYCVMKCAPLRVLCMEAVVFAGHQMSPSSDQFGTVNGGSHQNEEGHDQRSDISFQFLAEIPGAGSEGMVAVKRL